MASIRRLANGKWRAEVFRAGKRKSKMHSTKRAAQLWAQEQEYTLTNEAEIKSRMPLRDLLDRYGREVSSQKRGARPEIIRLERIGRSEIGAVSLCDLTVTDFAKWRDVRLREVKGASVRRELEQLSAVLRRARDEWGLMSHNPLTGLVWPAHSPPRERLPTDDEIERLRISAGTDLGNATARTFHAWMFAIETGMRAGEIERLRLSDITGRVARLRETKNGHARDVPLSGEALRLIEALPACDPVFGLTSAQISALWRKLRDRAGVKDLTFHDSRHAAVTQLSKKLTVLELAKMIGHRDIRMLMTYYEPEPEETAGKLD